MDIGLFYHNPEELCKSRRILTARLLDLYNSSENTHLIIAIFFTATISGRSSPIPFKSVCPSLETSSWRIGMGKREHACRPLFQAHALVQCQYIHVRYRACLVPVLQWYGHPHSKTLVRIWASPSHITLAIRVTVRVTGDAHIVIVPAQSIPVSDYIGCNIKPLTSFHFPLLDFIWTVLIFILFYFEWRDTENKQYLAIGPWFFYGDQPLCYSHTNGWSTIFVQQKLFYNQTRQHWASHLQYYPICGSERES